MVLIGHPTGNPNSHHAALAHYEAGRLEAFCVPWFPGARTLDVLAKLPGCRGEAARLRRRHFEPLAGAPKIQGRFGEWNRLARRAAGLGSESLSYEANDWLMRAMSRAVKCPDVSAVHSYEDCSLWQFEKAKRLGKQCIYDMPIGYYPWWEEKQKQLAHEFSDWLPKEGLASSRYARRVQKVGEMELADLVLVACSFVEKTIGEFFPDKRIARAPYGVDAEFWCPAGSRDIGSGRSKSQKTKDDRGDKIRFIYAGQSSIRKGTPVLMEAWSKADMRNAELLLVGSWQLAGEKLKQLPRGVRVAGPVGPECLRELYRESDVFVFPSFFEGFGLVILEALACGLPVISTERSAAPDVLNESCGRLTTAGRADELAEVFRWFADDRTRLGAMKSAAREQAEKFTWRGYRAAVRCATAGLA